MDDQWIIAENIARYRQMLATERDADKRAVLTRLLAEFEEKLTPKPGSPQRQATNRNQLNAPK